MSCVLDAAWWGTLPVTAAQVGYSQLPPKHRKQQFIRDIGSIMASANQHA